ncbi:hypothetical protein [Marivita hallyeonensis]|uniref:Uncharacterized protein n=1 Tax=Marivita hallyeonensis TaxID=996342 RepID=A0A1M5TPY0_9RHOB|nr:hypothetical protein [Marivita hallyeonensis]SHH52453.1 hypothetical protein SAMN05443551_2307 [Marivita hallyeonensis]
MNSPLKLFYKNESEARQKPLAGKLLSFKMNGYVKPGAKESDAEADMRQLKNRIVGDNAVFASFQI